MRQFSEKFKVVCKQCGADADASFELEDDFDYGYGGEVFDYKTLKILASCSNPECDNTVLEYTS